MTRMNKLSALAAVAALSLGLAACGGGGSTAGTDPDPTPDPEPMVVGMSNVTTGGADYMAPADGRLVIVAGMSETSGDVTFTCAAGGADCEVTIADGTATYTGGMVTAMDSSAYTTRLADAAEEQRQMDVRDARSAAMQSYMDADADAMKAAEAADAAEEAAPGSPGAMAARDAANAARTAADNAKAAHDAIMDDMTKAEADAQAAMAAKAAMDANDEYMTAKAENDDIQTGVATAEEQQRKSDVAAAKKAANAAVMAAETAKNNAAQDAMDAEQARDDAETAYMMAMDARTDHTTAKEEYEKAKDAAAAARTAANNAEAAYNAAKMAADGIMDDGTADAAEMAQETAETEQGNAETEAGKAAMEKMTAETAEVAAMMAADTHVLGLLKSANAVDVMDATPSTDENEARTAAIAAAATAVGTAAGAADNGEGTTTATATWPGVVDDPDTEDTDESAGSVLSIMVDPAASGTALAFRTEAAEDDPTTDAVDESMTMPQTVDDDMAGLGDFDGFSISDGNRHVIVFTDRNQDEAPVAAVTAITASEHTNLTVDTSAHTITDLGSKSGTTYTGVTFYQTANVDVTAADHDAGNAFMGSLSCPDGVTCNIQTDADGAVTAITGYQFSGSRAARAAVTAMTAEQQAAANQDYLIFGVWMREDSNGDGTADDADFGAFAAGGSTAPVAVEITGMAKYEGSATGVYTAGDSVDYFQGNATLTANFGAPGTATDPDAADDEAGTITGMINGIVAGGVNMSDVIYLNDDDDVADGNIVAAGTFGGNARMGTSNTVDDVTTYSHNGSWSGQFYNGTADDTDTTDVNESHVAPGSVAGHFGVTGTVGEGDDAVTRSYVGAFGADKD